MKSTSPWQDVEWACLLNNHVNMFSIALGIWTSQALSGLT